MTYFRLFTLFLFLNVTLVLSAQKSVFTNLSQTDKTLPVGFPKTKNFNKIAIVRLDENALRTYLQNAPLEFHNNGVTIPLDIPLPNGQVETFGLVESPVLAPEIAARHPEIKTYTGNGLKNKQYSIRISLTSSGFNAIVLGVADDVVYFEPYSETDRSYYFSYFSRDAFMPEEKKRAGDGCLVGKVGNIGVRISNHAHESPITEGVLNNTGASLRTFRLAVAASGEFTQVYAGADSAAKKTAAYNGIVAYVNRMNAVYRRELCASFSLVSDTDIVFADKTTDHFSHSNSNLMLDQCHTLLNAKILPANYDIGHVVGQSSGSGEGLAQTSSLCDDTGKGKGLTKIGDLSQYAQIFFDQAFFHEIGHQFSMDHSYNSSVPVCTTRDRATSVEPGAGATIMSYGFTCANTNSADGLVGNDDYFTATLAVPGPFLNFHTKNYSQAVTYMASVSTCGTTTATNNTLPVVTGATAKTIPKSTPFSLTGSATDANGDALTYSWEGTNIGETASPIASTLADATKPPFFRSYEPVTTPTRTYPLLSAILSGSNYAKGDKLPSVAIATTHRFTVRDNRAGGSSTVFSEVTVTVDGSSGPFLETTNLTGSFPANSPQTITWSVNNTDGTNGSTVSVANVKISLSTDGGLTFPTVLLASTPNDGSASITLPNVLTTTARIKVEAIDNIFFDISNVNFQIAAPLPIELTRFDVSLKGKNDAFLSWQTASEKNNKGFDVEMAEGNPNNFKKVDFVKGNGTTATKQDYQLTLSNLSPNVYYFRLKQMDMDGTSAYSPVRPLRIKGDFGVKTYPNPIKNEMNLELYFEKDSEMQLQLVNQIGQVVVSLPKTKYAAGRQIVVLNTQTLPSGLYFYQCQTLQQQVQGRVVIVH